MSQNLKIRDSSLELFRILATLLVVIVHLNGWLLGGMPESFTFEGGYSFRIGQMIIESLSVVCVNCFIILSGYFGMRLSINALWKMFFTLICVYFPCWIVTSIVQHTTTIEDALNSVLVFSREGYFVQCYLMLLFLSPILNSFLEKYGKSSAKYVFLFWGIEIWLEHVRGNISLGFNHGYSVIHFVLLYMIARVFSMYKDEITKRITPILSLCLYLLCASIICIEYVLGWARVWDYSNPIIILETFFLFIPFVSKSFYCDWINGIARSTFTVYVLHTCKPMNPIIRDINQYVCFNNPYWIYLPFMLLFAFFIFSICIVYDKIRIKITAPFEKFILTRISEYNIL